MNFFKLLMRISIPCASVGALLASAVQAQQIQHLSTPQKGGMPGVPVVTGVEQLTNAVRVTWDGPSGYYQLLYKHGLADSQWQPLGARTNLERRATVSGLHSNAFFRVEGPAPNYAGARACAECHESVHNSAMDTRHAQAFESLRKAGQEKNPSCLPCHTVGFALPTGYSSEFRTPHLRGVQCESCHGPAGLHAANETDPLVRPRVEIASQVCGGCHTGSHQPTFDEWHTSGHARVVEDMNPAGRIDSCGRCHSGSARLSMFKGDPLPVGDANMGIECITCHNPHAKTPNPAQLHNPLTSTNDYFVTTRDTLLSQYNPEINVCAQCHNHRGAAWTNTSRPPHHSPQYNVLLGTVGELPSGTAPHRAAHAGLEKQCITCHMQQEEFKSQSEPAITGHTFRVRSFDSCKECHPLPEDLAEFTAFSVDFYIERVKAALEFWAMNKAPASLREAYGLRAWEYTTPGELSPGGPGPNSAEQALIPEKIKKARFNLYIVISDGSYGAHNGPHSIALLEAALDWAREASSE